MVSGSVSLWWGVTSLLPLVCLFFFFPCLHALFEKPQNEVWMKTAERKECLFHDLPFQNISKEKWQISTLMSTRKMKAATFSWPNESCFCEYSMETWLSTCNTLEQGSYVATTSYFFFSPTRRTMSARKNISFQDNGWKASTTGSDSGPAHSLLHPTVSQDVSYLSGHIPAGLPPHICYFIVMTCRNLFHFRWRALSFLLRYSVFPLNDDLILLAHRAKSST